MNFKIIPQINKNPLKVYSGSPLIDKIIFDGKCAFNTDHINEVSGDIMVGGGELLQTGIARSKMYFVPLYLGQS